jgi:hypothetical protein
LLESLKSEINELKNFLNNCDRKEPIGQDSEQNTYWKFNCLPNYIVRESRNKLSFDDFLNDKKVKKKINKSTKWFKYNLNTQEFKSLIRYLNRNENSNESLIAALRKLEETQNIDDLLIEKNDQKTETSTNPRHSLNVRRSKRINIISDDISQEEEDGEEIILASKEDSIFEMFNELEPIDALYNASFKLKY